MSLRFLHTSDIHLLDLAGVGPLRYLNKRLTGGINLALRRRTSHQGGLFDRMMELVEPLRVERVVVTGDLTNLALEPEFELVRKKLEGLPVPATVIPGNHDVYTRGSARAGRFERYMAPFMAGDRLDDASYPFVQRFEGVALIGVSTAIATLPLHATGLVGEDQLARLREILAITREESRARVVLIHHPPVPGVSKKRHDLLDVHAFGEVLLAEGAELVLHGHEHRRIESMLPGPDGPIPVHGIGSGTVVSQVVLRRASFSVYDASLGAIKREVYEWNGSEFVSASAAP
jgi:3',5'-cyclic AMP phosphodiesterase CpdA